MDRYISIHAPRKGERQRSVTVSFATNEFQSTLPARGSDPPHLPARYKAQPISIHAPRKGERPAENNRIDGRSRFQSTLPARGSDVNDFFDFLFRQ